jgi:ketosteroid isomerase-like protein
MTMRSRTTQLCSAVLVLFPLLTAGAQAAKQQSSNGSSAASASARTAIDAANKRFVDLFNKGDAAGAAKVYASDAVVMPPNGPTLHGQAAMADFWGGAYKNGVRNVALTTTEFVTHGSYAHELGTYQLEVHGADGNIVARDNGKYMVLWKRGANGEWQWYRDIYNSSVPAPASK